jgi:hypothetical protein
MHGEVTIEFWEICKVLRICPWCSGDTNSHGLGCTLNRRGEAEAERELKAGLRPHELEAVGYFVTLRKSDTPDHFWLMCHRSSCGALVHLRKPPPFPPHVVAVFERVKPIASDRPIEVRPVGLCVGDGQALARHVFEHQRGNG